MKIVKNLYQRAVSVTNLSRACTFGANGALMADIWNAWMNGSLKMKSVPPDVDIDVSLNDVLFNFAE